MYCTIFHCKVTPMETTSWNLEMWPWQIPQNIKPAPPRLIYSCSSNSRSVFTRIFYFKLLEPICWSWAWNSLWKLSGIPGRILVPVQMANAVITLLPARLFPCLLMAPLLKERCEKFKKGLQCVGFGNSLLQYQRHVSKKEPHAQLSCWPASHPGTYQSSGLPLFSPALEGIAES